MAASSAPRPIKQVFLSYGSETVERERILGEFVDHLKRKLRYLPQAPARGYEVALWFCRDEVHARSATFDEQTVAACRKSDAIVLMLSDKFYASPHCRAEVDCFRDRHGTFAHHRAVKIQFTGRRTDGSAEMATGPVQPCLFAPAHPTLLSLWTKGDEHLREEFLLAIRDDLLAILDR